MKRFKYVIVGAGMTADAAAAGIRKVDPNGSFAVIGDEADPPYDRPPLTKALWKNKTVDDIWRRTASLRVELALQRRVVQIRRDTKQVLDDHGESYGFEKLLLATGGTPRRLPVGGGDILYYRTLQDYRRLREIAATGSHFAVVGSGFIGSELAAALTLNGKCVWLLSPTPGIGSRLFPADLALTLSRYYESKGVAIVSGNGLAAVQRVNGRYAVRLEDGTTLKVDAVVAGIGIEPNVKLAADAGLATGNGIVVNEFLETSCPGIYAAGDVAEFHNPLLGKRLRVEHEDNARAMGKAAGRNMAGEKTSYDYLPYFYSDLFDLGYEAIGETDPRLETISVWTEPYKKGVIFYLDRHRVRGLVFWNVWDAVPAGRELMAQAGPFDKGLLSDWVMRLPRG